MSKTTFWDIIERTIQKVGTPLSAKEIWDKANNTVKEVKEVKDFSLPMTGVTPTETQTSTPTP